jgi:hypothetical protein
VIIQAMHALEGMCLRMRAGTRMPDGDLSKMLDLFATLPMAFITRKRKHISSLHWNSSALKAGTARSHFCAVSTERKEDY